MTQLCKHGRQGGLGVNKKPHWDRKWVMLLHTLACVPVVVLMKIYLTHSARIEQRDLLLHYYKTYFSHLFESVLMGKPEGKRPLGRPRRRWADNIKINLREIGWDDVDWIELGQDRDQWRALVNTVMKLRVP
jgi:hypothetical protein